MGRFHCTGAGYGAAAPRALVPRVREPDYFVAPFAVQPQRDERHMFNMFREQLAPTLLDVFDEDFWAVAIPQAGQIYPSVWHAMVATATLQNLRLIKDNRSDDGIIDEESLLGYALRHCNMSLHHLRQVQPATATSADWEMVLLTCIVLICYSSLRGNFDEALTHIRNGFYLSNIWHSRGTIEGVSKSSRLSNCITTISSIQLRFRRLEVLTFLAPFQLSESAVKRCRIPNVLPDVPFSDTSEAYLELLSIDVGWKTIVRSQVLASGHIKLEFLSAECRILQLPFTTWKKKFYALQRTLKPLKPSDANYRVESMRRLVLQLLDFTLEAMVMVNTDDGEMAWDKFNDNFEHMVDIVGYILKLQEREALNYSTSSLTESLQFRSVIGLPMVAVGHICRVPHVRTRGIALLKSIPFTDGILDSTFFIALTQEQQRVEEQGVFLVPFIEGCTCVHGKFVCNNHRVSQFIMSPPGPEFFAKVWLRTVYDVSRDQPGIECTIPLPR